jgi:hypothetical protein
MANATSSPGRARSTDHAVSALTGRSAVGSVWAGLAGWITDKQNSWIAKRIQLRRILSGLRLTVKKHLMGNQTTELLYRRNRAVAAVSILEVFLGFNIRTVLQDFQIY